MIEIPVGLPPELVPLSWLIGTWEGDGVLDYRVGDDRVLHEFHQRIVFAHDGGRHLTYTSTARLERERIDAEPADASEPAPSEPPASEPAPAAADPTTDEPGDPRFRISETGYWSLRRTLGEADAGPGMLPPGAGTGSRGEPGAHPYPDAESVETLRNEAGGFDLQVVLVHPDGVGELYLGGITGPRIELTTDAVLRGPGSKDYSAAERMYGLVDGHLLWAWDIAALGQSLRTHASARLAKVD